MISAEVGCKVLTYPGQVLVQRLDMHVSLDPITPKLYPHTTRT